MAIPFPASVEPSPLRRSEFWCKHRSKFDGSSRPTDERAAHAAALFVCVLSPTSSGARPPAILTIDIPVERRALTDCGKIATESQGGSNESGTLATNGSALSRRAGDLRRGAGGAFGAVRSRGEARRGSLAGARKLRRGAAGSPRMETLKQLAGSTEPANRPGRA